MEDISSLSNLAAVRRIANPSQAAHRTGHAAAFSLLDRREDFGAAEIVLKIVAVNSGFSKATYTVVRQSGRSTIDATCRTLTPLLIWVTQRLMTASA